MEVPVYRSSDEEAEEDNKEEANKENKKNPLEKPDFVKEIY